MTRWQQGRRVRSRRLWPERFRPMGQREARHGADWGRLAPGRVGIMWGKAPRTGKAPYLAHCLGPRASPQIPWTTYVDMYGEADSVTSQATASAMESIVKHDHLPRISQPRIHAGQSRPPPPRLASGREAAAIRAKAADFAVQCRPCVAVEAPEPPSCLVRISGVLAPRRQRPGFACAFLLRGECKRDDSHPSNDGPD